MRNNYGSIHPALIGRPRRLWLGTLTAAACVAGLFYAGSSVNLWPFLAGLTTRDAQASAEPDRATSGRVAQAHSSSTEVGPPPELHNNISQQANEWGVTTCLSQIATISDFLTANQTYSALSRRGGPESDAAVFTSTIAGRDAAGLDSVSTFVSAPMAGSDCQSAYQTVAAFQSSCADVRPTHFAAFTETLALGEHVDARHNGRGTYVYFLPIAETACVIVKTQMIN